MMLQPNDELPKLVRNILTTDGRGIEVKRESLKQLLEYCSTKERLAELEEIVKKARI